MRKQEKGERSRERKRMSGAGQKQNVTWGEKSRQSKEETEGGDADKSVRDSEKWENENLQARKWMKC